MIRLFLYLLLAMALGAGLWLFMGDDPGLVSISFRGYAVEATVATTLIVLVFFFVVGLGLYWLVKTFNPLKLFNGEFWHLFSSRKKAMAASERGMELLLLGHWQDAYKLLVENADNVELPVFNYLAACLAAFQKNDLLARNYCLDQAQKASSGKRVNSGVRNLKAMLELRSGQVEQSLAILQSLDKEKPGSPYVLNLLKGVYLSLGDWDTLQALLPRLEKYNVLNSVELQNLRERILLHKIEGIRKENGGYPKLEALWTASDKKLKENENVVLAYLKKCIAFDQKDAALSVALTYMRRRWSDKVLLLTGHIQGSEPGTALLHLEKWLKDRPNNAPLMLTLGRVCLMNKYWGKARGYFENALRFSKQVEVTAEINAELARLYEALGEHEKSVVCYSRTMELLNHKLPVLPMPELEETRN